MDTVRTRPALPITVETYRDLAMAPHLSLQSRVRAVPQSPTHHGPSREMSAVDMIVMHCTAGASAMSSIEYLNTTADIAASYHFVIDRDGLIYRMCPVTVVAYHAGDSAWPTPVRYPPGNGGRSVNARSVGIAWANRNDGIEQLTRAQVSSALWLCSIYTGAAYVSTARVLSHAQVSPGRKTDPVPETMPMDVWRTLLSLYLREEGPSLI